MSERGDGSGVLAARVRLPPDVVRREFPTETVVLNLGTGQYHGLNPTAGRMLAALEEADTVGAAVHVVAEEYGQPVELVQEDLLRLCSDLQARALIELDAPDAG